MKMMKKVLSGICALSLLATAVASLTVSADATKPSIYPVITVNEAAKTADIEIRMKNIPTQTDDSYKDPTYIYTIGLQFEVDSYAASATTGMSGRNFTTWKNTYYQDNLVGMDPMQSADAGYISLGKSIQSVSDAKAVGQTKADMSICTIKALPLSDSALKNGFTVDTKNFQLVLNTEYWGTGDAYEMAYIEGSGTADSESASWAPTVATEAPTAAPVVTEAPTAEPTAEPTATPTVDPAAATVSELQESDADDKNAANLDYAKAIYKSFAGSELVGKRVAWTINGKTAAFDYAIADVDGDVVVGLVIMDTVADALNAITAATAAIVD